MTTGCYEDWCPDIGGPCGKYELDDKPFPERPLSIYCQAETCLDIVNEPSFPPKIDVYPLITSTLSTETMMTVSETILTTSYTSTSNTISTAPITTITRHASGFFQM